MSEQLAPTDFTQLNAEADDELIAQLSGVKNPADSKGVFATFYMGAEENAAKSAEAGRPIYDDVPFVRVQVKGDKDNIIDRPAWIDKSGRHPMAHNVRFPEQWLRFRAGQAQGGSGTPLAMMPGITKGQIAELAHFEVKTIEDLAGLSDTNGQNFRGFQKLKQSAQDYIDRAAQAAPDQKLRAALEQRDNIIETQGRQIAEQAKAIDELRRAAGLSVPTSAPIAAPAVKLDREEFTRPETGVPKPAAKRATKPAAKRKA